MKQITGEFVYNGITVVKTGRLAKKNSSKETLRGSKNVEEVLVEIIPADLEDGSWKKWVVEADLFIVEA